MVVTPKQAAATGETAAQPKVSPRQKIDMALLDARTACMPYDLEDAGQFLRRLRDAERY